MNKPLDVPLNSYKKLCYLPQRAWKRKNKNLLSDAINDAKIVKEAAMENAKQAINEAFHHKLADLTLSKAFDNLINNDIDELHTKLVKEKPKVDPNIYQWFAPTDSDWKPLEKIKPNVIQNKESDYVPSKLNYKEEKKQPTFIEILNVAILLLMLLIMFFK